MMQEEMRAAGKELSEAGDLAGRQFQADAAEAVDALGGATQSAQEGLAGMAGSAVNAAADAIEDAARGGRQGEGLAEGAAQGTPVGVPAGAAGGSGAQVSEPVEIPGVDEPLEKVKGVDEPVEVLDPTLRAAVTPDPQPATPEPPSPPPGEGHQGGNGGRGGAAQNLKLKLVEVLASLDRGVAATREQQQVVQDLCRQMEAEAGAVVLSWEKTNGKKPSMAALDGRWRLIYSSGFASGSLGGARPGPSIPLSPLKLGQVSTEAARKGGQNARVVASMFACWPSAEPQGCWSGVEWMRGGAVPVTPLVFCGCVIDWYTE